MNAIILNPDSPVLVICESEPQLILATLNALFSNPNEFPESYVIAQMVLSLQDSDCIIDDGSDDYDFVIEWNGTEWMCDKV